MWPPFTLPPPTPAFTVVTERLNAERRMFKERLQAAVTPLHALLARHMQAFMTCAEGWQLHGEFARAAAASCTELTLLLPSREALPGGDAAVTSLMEGVHTACGALMRGQPLGGGASMGPALKAPRFKVPCWADTTSPASFGVLRRAPLRCGHWRCPC